MSPTSRILGVLCVLLLASCIFPPHGRATEMELVWTDNNTTTTLPSGDIEDRRPTHANVYEQTTVGVVLPGLTGRWTKIATSPRTSTDADATQAGFQQRHVIASVSVGNHSYAVTLENGAGVGPPSNIATATVTPTTIVVAPGAVGTLTARPLP